MIVLDEYFVQAGNLVECLLIEAFEEKTTVVTKDRWLDYQYVGNVGGNNIHGRVLSCSGLLR
jgi:hypothetical protein